MIRPKRRILILFLSIGLVNLFGISPANAIDCTPTFSTSGSNTLATFTNSTLCDWDIPSGVSSINVLVVAGGGGGGYDAGGGGGGGGVDSRTALSVTPGNFVQVSVGTGGTGATTGTNVTASFGGSGTSSTFSYSSTSISTAGGGGGGNCYFNGTYCRNNSGGTAGTGGGNGGKGPWNGSRTNTITNGGAGMMWSINSTTYGGGGGGAAGGDVSYIRGLGGSGGGGDGGQSSSGGNGTPNTGGGGGGGAPTGGNGAAGIVIISYATPSQTISISSQPSSANPDLGSSITLTVLANSLNSGTLSYQWYRKANSSDVNNLVTDSGTSISGATTNSLTLNSVGSNATGIYRVKVSNALAGVTTWLWSNNAVVYVSLANETFQNQTLASPSDWVMTYQDAFAPQGATEPAFGPCLTAIDSNQETVSATNPVTVGTINTSAMKGCHYNYGGSSETVTSTAGQGTLRLTQSVNDQATFVLYNTARSTSDGLDIRFNSAQWGSSNSNGDSADGFTFFLKDGSDSNNNPGTSGGALGYSTNRSQPGVQGGLLGIGFDVYGNYANDAFGGSSCQSNATTSYTESSIQNYASSITRNGTANTYIETFTATSVGRHTANSIIIRGPQGSSTTNGYCVISPNPITNPATAALGKSATPFASTASDFNSRSTATRRIRVIIDQISSAIPNPKIYIYVDGVLKVTADLPQAYRSAPTFKFGFTGSTGGLNNKIDIWSTQVNTYSGITAPDAPDGVTTSAGSTAGSRIISWNHDNAWGLGEASSGTRIFTATLYDSNGNQTNYFCTSSATSGSPSNTCTITGIPAGNYTVKVTATNFSNLRSPPSTVSDVFTSNGDQVISSCSGAGALINGSFESETATSSFIDGTYANSWNTTALATRVSNTKAAIETWYTQGTDSSATNINSPANSYAEDGRYIAEIAADNGGDANSAGGVRQGLYQDVSSINGVRVFWSYWHHFRGGLNSNAQVSLFQAGPTPSNIPSGGVWTASEQATPFDTATPLIQIYDTVTSGSAWQKSSGTFVPNSSSTRFLFSNVTSPASGYGNLIDDVRFTTYAACPINVTIISGRNSSFVVQSNEQNSANFKFYAPQGASVANVSGVPANISLSVSNVANTSSTFSISSSTIGSYAANYQISYTFGGSTYTSTSTLNINVVAEASARFPKVVPVDPRSTSAVLGSGQISNATSAYVCLDQVLNLNADSISTTTFTLNNRSLASGVSSSNSGNVLLDSGTVSNLQAQFALMNLSSSPERLMKGGSKFLRLRVSSMDNTDGMSPSCSNGVWAVVEFRPITLTQRRTRNVKLGNGNS